MSIDWTDPECAISKHFKVREAILLPQWNRLARGDDGLTDEAKNALVILFQKMDMIRELIGLPILVHCAFRSVEYNALVGGAPDSTHIAKPWWGQLVAAVDWHTDVDGQTQGQSCDTIRAALLPKLEELGLRMEDRGFGANWIHIDNKPILSGHSRYFKP